HGEKIPVMSFPKDHCANYTFDALPGHLSTVRKTFWKFLKNIFNKKGKQRMFKLGTYLRKRYAMFLSDNPDELSVQSSSLDRCQESAALVVAGLYPPKGRQIWNTELMWQPISIRYQALEDDGVINIIFVLFDVIKILFRQMLNAASPCPNWFKELEKVQKSTKYTEYISRNKIFYEFLTTKTGLNVTDVNLAELVSEILSDASVNGCEMPNWVNESVWSLLQESTTQTYFYPFSTKRLLQLKAGYLIKYSNVYT
ncbi:putative acid phosphatase 1-like protein, partial [Leptotrombidium deliense]